MKMLAPRKNFMLEVPAIKVRHDKPSENPIIQNAQVIGRGVRVVDDRGLQMRVLKPRTNNIFAFKACEFFNHPRPIEPFTLKALKAACKAAGGRKAGIGHGHPAHRGFFAGRAKNRLKNGGFKHALPSRLLRPDFQFDNVGLRGVHIPIGGFGMFGGFARFGGGIGIDNQIHQIHQTDNDRPGRIARREKLVSLRKLGTNTEYDIILEPFLDELGKKHINVCEVFAKWVAKFKENGEWYNIIKRMKTRLPEVGYHLLGVGYFSAAFKGPDGWVYKTNCHTQDADSWYAFAVNCIINRKSQHLPLIDDIRSVNTTYCAKMELLSSAADLPWSKRAGGHSKFYGFETNCIDSVIRMFECREFDAINLMDVVQATKKQTGGFYDIHEDNVLFRVMGDSKTLVITDPIARGEFQMHTYEKQLEEFRDAEFNRKFAA